MYSTCSDRQNQRSSTKFATSADLSPILGVNGAGNTVVARAAPGTSLPRHRVFSVSHGDAVLDSLTISNGYWGTPNSTIGAGGVRLNNGTIRNCVFRKNISVANATDGGAVYMAAGLVEDCEFYDNYVGSGSADGGAVYMVGGTVRRATVRFISQSQRVISMRLAFARS